MVRFMYSDISRTHTGPHGLGTPLAQVDCTSEGSHGYSSTLEGLLPVPPGLLLRCVALRRQGFVTQYFTMTRPFSQRIPGSCPLKASRLRSLSVSLVCHRVRFLCPQERCRRQLSSRRPGTVLFEHGILMGVRSLSIR